MAMIVLVFILISSIHCHLIVPQYDIAHEENVTQLSKTERVFVPHHLNESLGVNVTKEFWDRYRQTSFIMMQILTFHQLFYSYDGTLTPAAASILLQNIHFEKFQYMNYSRAETKECVYESFQLLPPNIQKKITRFLKSVKDKYMNQVKEPRIAAKAKKILKAFRTGEIFSYDDSLLSLSVKNMTANEEWEASVFDPVRLVYLEYSTFAETNGKIVIDPLPYIKKFESYYGSIVPDERYLKTESNETESSSTPTPEKLGNGTDFTFHPKFLSTNSFNQYSTAEKNQQQTQSSDHTVRPDQTDQATITVPSYLTALTDQTTQSERTGQTDQTNITAQSVISQSSQAPPSSSTDQTSNTSITNETDQATTTSAVQVPVQKDIFSFSFLQHQPDIDVAAVTNTSETTTTYRSMFMTDWTTVETANSTESTTAAFPSFTTIFANMNESTSAALPLLSTSFSVLSGSTSEVFPSQTTTSSVLGSTTSKEFNFH